MNDEKSRNDDSFDEEEIPMTADEITAQLIEDMDRFVPMAEEEQKWVYYNACSEGIRISERYTEESREGEKRYGKEQFSNMMYCLERGGVPDAEEIGTDIPQDTLEQFAFWFRLGVLSTGADSMKADAALYTRPSDWETRIGTSCREFMLNALKKDYLRWLTEDKYEYERRNDKEVGQNGDKN